jgi:hypothetical protein
MGAAYWRPVSEARLIDPELLRPKFGLVGFDESL